MEAEGVIAQEWGWEDILDDLMVVNSRKGLSGPFRFLPFL